MGLFGAKKTTREKVREMISTVRHQKYQLQRDIDQLKATEKKITLDVKRYAKSNQIDAAKLLAREIVNTRKGVTKLRSALAHMDCIISELNSQAATVKLAESLQTSTSVMQSMSALIKLPELNKTMQNMGKEMMKMGLMDEMIEDTMESALGDSDDMEEATANEVAKILSEITTETRAKIPDVAPGAASLEPPAASVVEEDQEDLDEMRARLAALRN